MEHLEIAFDEKDQTAIKMVELLKTMKCFKVKKRALSPIEEALKDVEEGRVKEFDSAEELFKSLNLV